MKKQKKNTKTPSRSVMQPDTPRDSFVESDTKLIEFLWLTCENASSNNSLIKSKVQTKILNGLGQAIEKPYKNSFKPQFN